MIQLSPIDPSVQKTLTEKERILGNKSTTGIFDSQNDQDYLKNKGPVALALRTTFVRMTSLTGKNPIIIHGGELIDGKLRSGLKTLDKRTDGLRSVGGDLVGSIYGPIRDPNSGKQTKNKYYRPLPGLKSIDVQFKGGMKAMREGNVSWTCWNFEDLERLTPYFLWHGRNVLIEWGWVHIEQKKRPKLFNLNKISNPNVDSELIKHIRNQAGNYDAMIGTITNYEYGSRDDGGFDCTTKIIARGANLFKNTMTPINTTVTVGPRRRSDKKDTFIENKVSIKSYMATLREQLITVNDSHKLVLQPSASKKYGILWDENFGGLGPYCTLGFFEDNILSRFTGFVSGNKTLFEFRSIEPTYLRDGASDKVTDIIWNSVQVSNHKFLYTAHPAITTTGHTFGNEPEALIIPGQFPYELSTVSDEAMNAKGYELKSQENIHDIDYEGTYTTPLNVQNLLRLRELSLEFDKFAVPGSDTKRGYIRNLLLHYKLIQNAFEEQETLEGAMRKLFSSINKYYNNFWDFVITTSEDGKRMKIVDRRITQRPGVEYIMEANSKKKKYNTILGTLESKYNYDGMYIFPVWEANSIVKNQTFTAKLPDKMALGAIYGSGASLKKEEGVEGGEKDLSVNDAVGDRGAQIFGRLYNPNFDDKNEVYRDAIGGDISVAFKNNREFGNLTADPNKPLSVGGGSGVKGRTPLKTAAILAGGASVAAEEELKEVKEFKKENRGHKIDMDAIFRFREDAIKIVPIKELIEQGKETVQVLQEMIFSKKALTIAASEWKKWLGISKPEVVEGFPEGGPRSSAYMEKAKEAGNPDTKFYGAFGDLKKEYQDQMFDKITNDENGIHNTTDPPMMIDLELEIDGTGGIFPGNVFHSSYLPKKIRKSTVYQAMDVNHRVDSSFWSTTIRGQMRYVGDKAIKAEEKLKKELEDALFKRDKKTDNLDPDLSKQPRLQMRKSPDTTLEELSGAGSPIQRV